MDAIIIAFSLTCAMSLTPVSLLSPSWLRIRSAPLTLCNSRTSQTTSDAEIISFAPNSDNQALLNGLHVLTSSNTLPVESSSEGSPRSSSPEGESGSALVGGPPELSDSRSYSHCPIASSNPAANGCLPAKLNFELDSVTSPRDSTTPSCSSKLHNRLLVLCYCLISIAAINL